MKRAAVIITCGYLLVTTAKYWLADYYFAQGGIDNLKKAIALSPNEAVYHDRLAAEYSQFAPELAASELKKAISLSPRNTKILKSAASIYSDLGEDQKSLEIYNRLTELAPTDAQVWYQLALTHAKLKNFDKSLEILEKVLALKPDYELALKLKNLTTSPSTSPSGLEGDKESVK